MAQRGEVGDVALGDRAHVVVEEVPPVAVVEQRIEQAVVAAVDLTLRERPEIEEADPAREGLGQAWLGEEACRTCEDELTASVAAVEQ